MLAYLYWKYMPLVADWSVRAEPVDLSKLSHMTHTNAVQIKEIYRAGDLGPAPNVGAIVHQIPLYHAVAFFLVREAREKGVPMESFFDVLPGLAGAAYIQFLLAEIRAGHCVQRGGTPSLNPQLWALLHSAAAPKELEQKLPGGPVDTHRYAAFSEAGVSVSNDLDGLNTTENAIIIDAWRIRALMKRFMPGTFLHTHIA
jgi:hypothetical protein